ncbi:hypothetical protein D3C85_1752000 [compost metagenome]
MGKAIAAQFLQPDRGARCDVGGPGDHQATIAAIGALASGHGVACHAEDQPGVGVLLVIARNIDRIVGLQGAGVFETGVNCG